MLRAFFLRNACCCCFSYLKTFHPGARTSEFSIQRCSCVHLGTPTASATIFAIFHLLASGYSSGEIAGKGHDNVDHPPPLAPSLHLCAGASTATPLSQRLPKPPADLADVYLLTVLGADAGGGDPGSSDHPSLSIRSLGDRNVASRCPIPPAAANVEDGAKSPVVRSRRGARVYAPPGYGGGVFVVAAEGGRAECARVWRGTFDEGNMGFGALFSRSSLAVLVVCVEWPGDLFQTHGPIVNVVLNGGAPCLDG